MNRGSSGCDTATRITGLIFRLQSAIVVPMISDAGAGLFKVAMDVRDYECDLQGIVNNATYQNYLEHARHLYLESIGLDFAALHAEGVDPVVTRAELDYKRPLTSGDRFSVSLSVTRRGRLRFVFHQEIHLLGKRAERLRQQGEADDKAGVGAPGDLVLSARIVAVTLAGGRPVEPTAILDAITARYGAVPEDDRRR